MNTLKEALMSPLVLKLPNSTSHITWDADAFIVQFECILLKQQEDGTIKPIGYWSRSLTNAEREHESKQRELPAIA